MTALLVSLCSGESGVRVNGLLLTPPAPTTLICPHTAQHTLRSNPLKQLHSSYPPFFPFPHPPGVYKKFKQMLANVRFIV